LTNAEAFTSTFKALVGIGILSCPSAFKEVGLIGGIFGCCLIIGVINAMYAKMVKVVQKTSTATCRSLGEISGKIYGPNFRSLTEGCIFGN